MLVSWTTISASFVFATVLFFFFPLRFGNVAQIGSSGKVSTEEWQGMRPICFCICLKGKSSSPVKRLKIGNGHLLKQLQEATLLISLIWAPSSLARLAARLLPQVICNISFLTIPQFFLVWRGKKKMAGNHICRYRQITKKMRNWRDIRMELDRSSLITGYHRFP